MGMGEPLANYDNLLKALKILNAPWGGGIGARKITISTSGLAPQIRKLADEPLQFRLAISLHGATDEVRAQIMPVNKKYPLKELINACAVLPAKKGRMMTLEYILIAGVNDSMNKPPLPPLHKRRSPAKVNLIPYNTVEGLDGNGLRKKSASNSPEALRKAKRHRHITPRKRPRHRRRLRAIAIENRTRVGEKLTLLQTRLAPVHRHIIRPHHLIALQPVALDKSRFVP